LSEKNAIIKKYEAQSKKFIEEITELQAQNDTHKQTIMDLKERNQNLTQKITKLEGDLVEQKGREKKPKNLHDDEEKCIMELNGHEFNLYESKIKELEEVIQSL